MYPAFSQYIAIPQKSRPQRRADHLSVSHAAPLMRSRRPGTRSHKFFFWYRTSSQCSSNEFDSSVGPPPRSTENVFDNPSTTVDAEQAEAPYLRGSDVGKSDIPSMSVGWSTSSAKAATATTTTTPMTELRRSEEPSTSFPLRIPFLGQIQIPGSLVLMVVPFLWASYSITLKWLFRLPWALDAALFNFFRLTVGSIMVLPALTPKTATKPVIVAGAELGLWAVLTNILQIIGLRFTSASRAAFLSQLATVLVPLMAVLFGMESRLSMNIIISAPLAVLGVALLTLDGSVPSPIGDGLMIVVAFVATGYILRSKRYSSLPTNALVASKTIFQTLYSGIYFFLTSAKPISFVGATRFWIVVNAGMVIWAGFFICYLSTVVQMRGQAMVNASEAAVIFATNPLWASLLAIPLGERLGPKGLLGASFVLVATVLASGLGAREEPQKQVGKVG